jgi:ABC-2 type transport system ATP-binding protein
MGIKVENLTKIYQRQRAVDGVSFEIKTGEIVGFLGPNGAGKTTTMKMLTCFLPPTSGDASLDGYSIYTHPLEIRRRIGYLPEHNPLYLDMYVHEYLKFVGRLYSLPASKLKARVAEVIEMTGLGREQHKQIGMLSKGYRQRVGLSAALIHDPEVLILDEPTTGLDPNQIVEIRSLIKEIGKQKTIIFSTHILPEVEAVADRVIIINRGTIVADRSMDEVHTGTTPETMLSVELLQPGFDLKPVQAMQGVTGVLQDGPTRFRIKTQQDTDLRGAIFQEVVRQGHVLLTFQREEITLEAVFRNLTQKTAP